jgi:hypothetical protein
MKLLAILTCNKSTALKRWKCANRAKTTVILIPGNKETKWYATTRKQNGMRNQQPPSNNTETIAGTERRTGALQTPTQEVEVTNGLEWRNERSKCQCKKTTASTGWKLVNGTCILPIFLT